MLFSRVIQRRDSRKWFERVIQIIWFQKCKWKTLQNTNTNKNNTHHHHHQTTNMHKKTYEKKTHTKNNNHHLNTRQTPFPLKKTNTTNAKKKKNEHAHTHTQTTTTEHGVFFCGCTWVFLCFCVFRFVVLFVVFTFCQSHLSITFVVRDSRHEVVSVHKKSWSLFPGGSTYSLLHLHCSNTSFPWGPSPPPESSRLSPKYHIDWEFQQSHSLPCCACG